MKKLLFIFLLAFSAGLQAQNPNYTSGTAHRGTSNAYVIFDKAGTPVKIYADAMDAIHFCSNQPYSNQQINLYYFKIQDTALWEPNSKMSQDNVWNPEPLTDKFLAVDTVYLVMQKNFNLADRAYTFTRLEEFTKYVENHNPEYLKIPYYYRDKRSFDEVYRIKKQRLQK
ncbi:MAG: hypothetical protein LBH92_03940 [Bacteroidales bacterium]|jgi:hypothetical protein|nr:hypothetical protein [Bacteroidales bacterium]